MPVSFEGLGPSPEPIYLFVDLGKTSEEGQVFPWHMFDGNNAIPVFEPALTGQLININIQIKTYKDKQNYKVNFTIKSNTRIWYVRSGIETTFTRGVILALSEVDDLTQPLTLLAKCGDEVVYGSIWNPLTGNRFMCQWDKEMKLFPIINHLQKQLGQEVQTVESIKLDFDNLRKQ